MSKLSTWYFPTKTLTILFVKQYTIVSPETYIFYCLNNSVRPIMNGLIQTLITDSYLCTASFCVGPKYLTVSAHTKKQSFDVLHARAAYVVTTRSSAIAEEPRDASCQLKYCQLPRNSAETTYTTSPDEIDGMKLEM